MCAPPSAPTLTPAAAILASRPWSFTASLLPLILASLLSLSVLPKHCEEEGGTGDWRSGVCLVGAVVGAQCFGNYM